LHVLKSQFSCVFLTDRLPYQSAEWFVHGWKTAWLITDPLGYLLLIWMAR